MTLGDDLERARAGLRMVSASPFNAEAPPEALREDITRNELHYVRSNFALPDHDGTLMVGGAIEHELRLTLDDLRALPAVERAVTLECAGNGRLAMRPLPSGEPWGDNAVSTARWTGALLRDVLARAVPTADAVEVLCTGADGGTSPSAAPADRPVFARSLAIARATDPAAEVLLAYEMNGEPLPPDHGAPLRLVVPDWYAMASVKWLRRIDVLRQPFHGPFQTARYVYEWPDRPHEPVTSVRVRARVTDPLPGSVIPAGPYTIRGKAWSGTGPVTGVELSFKGGGDWFPATVEPAAEPHAWQSWSLTWEATPGRHGIRARATDAAGNVQPDVPPWNRLGYGNNAIEVTPVDVRLGERLERDADGRR
jgi:DMSO/TMAO reductase YedYZ molybdopterin-dependent catalytic subunit